MRSGAFVILNLSLKRLLGELIVLFRLLFSEGEFILPESEFLLLQLEKLIKRLCIGEFRRVRLLRWLLTHFQSYLAEWSEKP